MVVNFPMFTGEFEYRVDEKGRVPIPPKFRTEELKKDGVVLCPGMEKCITIYPISEWKKLADSLTSGPIIPCKLRKLNRAIFATAFNSKSTDREELLFLPSSDNSPESQDEVVVAGANTYFELWEQRTMGHGKIQLVRKKPGILSRPWSSRR